MKNQKLEIVLDDFNLSKKQLVALESDVNTLVAKHLIESKFSNSITGSKLRINPEWLGIYLKNFKKLDLLKKSKTFESFNLEKMQG